MKKKSSKFRKKHIIFLILALILIFCIIFAISQWRIHRQVKAINQVIESFVDYDFDCSLQYKNETSVYNAKINGSVLRTRPEAQVSVAVGWGEGVQPINIWRTESNLIVDTKTLLGEHGSALSRTIDDRSLFYGVYEEAGLADLSFFPSALMPEAVTALKTRASDVKGNTITALSKHGKLNDKAVIYTLKGREISSLFKMLEETLSKSPYEGATFWEEYVRQYGIILERRSPELAEKTTALLLTPTENADGRGVVAETAHNLLTDMMQYTAGDDLELRYSIKESSGIVYQEISLFRKLDSSEEILRVSLTQSPSIYPSITYPETYATLGQQIEVLQQYFSKELVTESLAK